MGRRRPSWDRVFWKSGDWASRFTFLPLTLSTNVYTLTETVALGNVRRGRLAYASGAQGSDRRLYLLNNYLRDSRMLTVWQDRPLASAGGAQVGHAHNVRVDPDGFARGWIVDHDYAFGQTAQIRLNCWRWDPALGANSLAQVEETGTTLTGLQRIVTAADASRTGGVVTATGLSPANGEPGGLVAGHTVTADFADNTYDGNFVVTSAVAGATTAQWAQALGDDGGAGAGTINDLDGVFPFALETVHQGYTLAARAWRLAPNQPPPSWTDTTHAVIFHAATASDPYRTSRGRPGLYLGHLTSGFVEWGALEVERIR